MVAIPTQGTVPELNYLLELSGSRREQKTGTGRALEFARRLMKHSTSMPPLYMKSFPIARKTEVVHVEHHLSHAASAYYTSGTKERQLIVTIDGIGNGVSVCLWRGENGKIEPIEKYGAQGSLGWFYSNVTEALGWWHGDGEGKTMGLAPYGDPQKVRGLLEPYHPKYAGGRLLEPHDFKTPHFWNEGGAYQWHLDDADDIFRLVQRYGRENIAAEAQRVLEEQVLEIVEPRLKQEGIDRLSCAGGVFLNVKLNQRVWESGVVRHQHIFPNAGDSGLAVGAALHAYHQAVPSAPIGTLDHLYLGPEYTQTEIDETLELDHLSGRFVDDPAEAAAELLADNKIVGWFQGRMESGPRALGARSILMSPTAPNAKEIINARVKFREGFRPFCPSMKAEARETYLRNSRQENFMITSFAVTEEKREKIPAVVHVDGTLRPQTVTKEANPLYWSLLDEVGRRTGEQVLLNTSFNVMGEPIVCTPQEAIRCFYSCGLDALVLGQRVLRKDG